MITKLQNFLYFYFINKKEYKFYNEILQYIQFDEINQQKPKKIKRLCFVIPGMPAYSGGHTSILRLGTYLSEFGYEVYYLSYLKQDINKMEKNARSNLNDYRGKILDFTYLKTFHSDIFIATSWQTVYYIRKLDGYKMYFIQDYEPYFYRYGEKYLLTKKTYELGLHMVSLGSWNKYMIEKNCNVKNNIEKIKFPYEKAEYKFINRNFDEYKNKKEISIAAYVKFDEKRAPYIIQYMLGNLENQFKKNNIKLNIKYFGADKNQKFINGTNLGKLNKDQLFNLYKECDFGIVASLSNISLVPYEMIATKLPIIEFEEGTFRYFFEDSCAVLTSFEWNSLFDRLFEYIENPEKLVNMTDKAFNSIQNLSWRNSALEFKNILDKVELS